MDKKYLLVKQRTTRYKIVADMYSDWKIRHAVNELVLFFEKATTLRLPVIHESEVKTDGSQNYIFVGKGKYTDKILKKKGLDKKLSANSFICKTENGNVYCVGGGGWGTIYSVYKFLNKVFGYRIYSYNEITLEKDVFYKELPEIDEMDGPSIEWRAESYGALKFNREFLLRMRQHSLHDIWIHTDNMEDGFCHNTQLWIPFTEENRSAHPDWFTKEGKEICFSSDGARAEIVRRLKEHLIEYPDIDNVTITQSDGGYAWCDCPKCTENYKKYGTHSGGVIKFCNKVSREIQDWFKEQGSDRQLNIAMFAYGQTSNPPTIEKDGKNVPIDDEVIMDDNVSLLFCGSPSGGDFFTDKRDEHIRKRAEGWKAVCKHINYWSYSANFWSYFNFNNTIDNMPSVYQYVKGLGAKFILDNAQSYNTNHPAWCYLKMFLNAEMQWNVKADMEALIDEFFPAYFKQGAVPMRKLFDSMREHYSHFYDIPRQNTNQLNEKPEYFPLELLQEWYGYIKEAIKMLTPPFGPLCPNYPAVYDRIILESITVRYLILKIYPQAFTNEEMVEEHRTLKDDIRRMGIKFYNEWITTEDFIMWLI